MDGRSDGRTDGRCLPTVHCFDIPISSLSLSLARSGSDGRTVFRVSWFYSGSMFTLQFVCAISIIDVCARIGSAKCTPIDCLNHNLWDAKEYPGLQSNNRGAIHGLGNAFWITTNARSRSQANSINDILCDASFWSFFLSGSLCVSISHILLLPHKIVRYFFFSCAKSCFLCVCSIVRSHWLL